MKLAIPDLISNSYFPALAAAELGFFEREGLDVTAELIFPVDRAYEALRDGSVDFVGGAAHGALAAFTEWRGVKLLGALAQGMYWFLVMPKELGIARGDLAALKGRRIGAAPWVGMGLRGLLPAAGLDPRRNNIRIGPVPGATGPGVDLKAVNFGLTAAQARERGEIDGFWANGMATEIAVTGGIGTIVLDVRRGDRPPGCSDYTMPALATADRPIPHSPGSAAAAAGALGATQHAVKRGMVDEYGAWSDRHLDPGWQDLLFAPATPERGRTSWAGVLPKTSDDLIGMGRSFAKTIFQSAGNITHTPAYGHLIAMGV